MDNNGVPPVDAEEQKALDELKKLQTAEQADVAADAKVVDVREAESKEMEEIEKTNPASLANPIAPAPTSDTPMPLVSNERVPIVDASAPVSPASTEPTENK